MQVGIPGASLRGKEKEDWDRGWEGHLHSSNPDFSFINQNAANSQSQPVK